MQRSFADRDHGGQSLYKQLRPNPPRIKKGCHQLMLMHAPVSGTVQQLAIHTAGGVVTPAQALLAVVPSEEALEVEATVLNKDISFVRLGQRVKVKSFPYTRYGCLDGTVESVSHDATQDEKMGPHA